MSTSMTLRKAIWWEVLFAILLSAPINLWVSMEASISFLLGAGVCIIPSGIFGQVFLRSGAEPDRVVRAFYYGEALKLFTTVALFVLVFQWRDLHPVFVFMGLFVIQLLHACLLHRLFR